MSILAYSTADTPTSKRRHAEKQDDHLSQSARHRNTSLHRLSSRCHITSTIKIPVPGQYHFLRHWWLEIGACFLFLISLIAIIVTLYPYQGKPLPQWPYQISINSVISVYVVVLKASIVFVIAEGLGMLHSSALTVRCGMQHFGKHKNR